MDTKLVVDAGPFIHLAQIGELDIFRNFPKIFVPASVLSEIAISGDPNLITSAIIDNAITELKKPA